MINDLLILRKNISGVWEEFLFSSQNNYVLGFDGTGLPVSKPLTTAANVALLDALAQEFTGTNTFKGASAQTQIIDGFIREYTFGASPSLSQYRANGTISVPTAVANGNLLANLNARGYGATGYKGGSNPDGRVTFESTENFTDAAHGCKCVIAVTPNGTINLVVAAVFDQDGGFFPQGDVHVPASKSIHIVEGPTAGAGTLVAGVAVISTVQVLASDRIIIIRQAIGEDTTAVGHLNLQEISIGSDFTVKSLRTDLSTETGDASSFYWILIRSS